MGSQLKSDCTDSTSDASPDAVAFLYVSASGDVAGRISVDEDVLFIEPVCAVLAVLM
jgi:hypothetical protein